MRFNFFVSVRMISVISNATRLRTFDNLEIIFDKSKQLIEVLSMRSRLDRYYPNHMGLIVIRKCPLLAKLNQSKAASISIK